MLSVLVVTPVLSLAADQDMLVSSQNTNSVKRYDGVTGAYVGDFIAPGTGGLGATQDIQYGPDGHVYVTGFLTSSLLKFHGQTGAFLGQFTHGRALDQPTKFTFRPDGMIYISQWSLSSPNAVLRFDATTGAYVDDFTGFVNQPMEQIWDAAGNMYVTSFGSSTVLKFDPSGNNLGSFTQPGTMNGPVSIRWGADSNMYVLDWSAGLERKYDPTSGAFLGNFVTSGLINPEGSIVGPDGFLYIADWATHRVTQHNATTGAFIKSFASTGGLNTPNDVAFMQQPVPEPSAMIALGIGTVALLRRRKRNK